MAWIRDAPFPDIIIIILLRVVIFCLIALCRDITLFIISNIELIIRIIININVNIIIEVNISIIINTKSVYISLIKDF